MITRSSYIQQVPFVDLKAQQVVITEELEREVLSTLRRTAFILGPEVGTFEEAFARYCGVRHAIGVANGTDALMLALKASDIGPGDEVITAGNAFIATAEAIVHAGARPVFVDVDPQTYNIAPEEVEARIANNTKPTIPVHLYGQPADMEPILEIARKHGLYVVEDAAQAHGAMYRGRKTGSLGDVACFSFCPSKNLGAYCDAGAVVTNYEQLALTARKLRDHGGIEKYQHDLIGHNSRLDTLQAAILLVKLKYIEQWNRLRQERALLYNRLLSLIPGIVTPAVLEGATHVYHLYVIQVERGSRDELQRYLQKRGIQTGIHYPTPIHLTRAFAHLGYQDGDFPVTEECAKRVLSLPMYPEFPREQIEYVTCEIERFMHQM